MPDEIVILGAGPAGMACAMELDRAGRKSILIEKSDSVGGLAKTLLFKESDGSLFRTDIGPHRFFSKNKYLYDFIEDLLAEKWIEVKRQTRQYINGKFYDYPVNAGQAFRNLGIVKSVEMFFSYLFALLRYRIGRKKIESFEDYIVAHFGRRLGEFNMLNYSEKIWGIPCKEIHADWARQRIKGLSIRSAIKNVFWKNSGKPKSLVDVFYYPQLGTGLIYETIAEKIQKSGSAISFNSLPSKITLKGDRITTIEYVQKGAVTRIDAPAMCVSSIPITELISILNPISPNEVLCAADKLRWRSQVYLFITLNKEKISNDNWIYFPTQDIPFGRVAEMKNFSKDMSHPDKTSLMIEFFCMEGDPIWMMDAESLFKLAVPHFEKMNFFQRSDVRAIYSFKLKHVYPIYDRQYQSNLSIVKKYLSRIQNLITIGRPGRFQYTNQDHSLEMGILAANSILQKKQCDLDRIGSEQEYFEKGFVRTEAQI